MKKFIAIVCILAMCLGVLAGCMEKVDNSVDTNAPVGVTLVYGENKIELFGKVLVAVIIDETIGKRGGVCEHH